MTHEVAVLGVGMHPFGRWGKSFVDLGVCAARAALEDAGVTWREVSYLASGAAMRCGTLGQLAARSFAEVLGWQGAELSTSTGGCTAGAQALAAARTKILAGECDLALVVCADVVPPGVLGPPGDPSCADANHIRHALGFTNPVYLALEARRRMALYGMTEDDLALVKVKNSKHGALNPNARYRYVVTADQVKESYVVADPLRLFHIGPTSDGAAALVLSSLRYARQRSRSFVILAGLSSASSLYPNPVLEMPHLASDSTAIAAGESFKDAVIQRLYLQTGIGPEDLSLAEVYDLSCASELDSYERIGLCNPGNAERLLRSGDTALGGRIPVNVSGGLASLGEAIAGLLARVAKLERAQRIEVRSPQDLEAYADADQLEQALINLIKNAIEAQGEAPGMITIVVCDAQDRLIVTVSDEGLGIANPDNLFVPFFTTKPGGSGIGLVLSRQIAEAHGGTLRLENRADTRGAVATLEIPAAARRLARMAAEQ